MAKLTFSVFTSRFIAPALLFVCNTSQAQMLPEDHPLCVKRSDIERFANAWVDEDKKTIKQMAPFCTITRRPVAASVFET